MNSTHWLPMVLGAAVFAGCMTPADRGPATAIVLEPGGSTAAFDSVLANIRLRTGVPALAAGAACGDSIIALGASGLRRLDGEQQVTIHDRFYVGSIGKSMTATTIARLVERGLLSWDSRVQDVLDLPGAVTPAFRDVTLSMLLSHRAGLPKFNSREAIAGAPRTGGTPMAQRRALAEWALAQAPMHPPGTRYDYSNAGYTVAVVMAEKITGVPWERTMQELLFEPLGLMSAGFGPPALHSPDQPWGHTLEGARFEPFAPERKDSWESAVLTGAGNVHMTIGDLVRYVRFHLQGLTGKPELLRAPSFRALHTPVDESSYALGWAVMDADGQPLSVHTGSDNTFYAQVLVMPSRNVAVAITANAAGGTVEEAFQEVLDELMERCRSSTSVGLDRPRATTATYSLEAGSPNQPTHPLAPQEVL
jgi:CubicO group peptidase (beta-lactamase class C family)